MNKEVCESYDRIADWFDDIKLCDLSFEKIYLDKLIEQLKLSVEILDIGCGTGRPIAQYLSNKGFKITGIDGSINMIEKAKKYVPCGTFIHQDMRQLNLGKEFDAIIMWHCFFHLTHAEQESMFEILKNHILLGGLLLFTTGNEHGEIWSDNGGEDLYHASFLASEYKDIIESHNFEIIYNKINDPDCGDSTVWLAKYKN